MNKRWTAQILEANDGSGDFIIEFPDDMLESLGWSEVTELNYRIEGEQNYKYLVFTKKEDISSCN